MRALTLALIVVSNLVVGIDNQIKIIYNIVNPAAFIAKLDGKKEWFAYKVKAQEGTASMCCLNNASYEISQCDLDNNNHSYGSKGESQITEHINIYVNVEKGQVKNMISVGDQCEVLASSHEITWLNDVTQESSIKWLKSLSFSDAGHTVSNALFPLALHESTQASQALFDIAAMNNDINSENAVFWLGESREDGFSYLQKLYNTLPEGRVKQHITFALSITESPQGVVLLKQIASEAKDSEQRAEALFWLGQKNVSGIVQILLDAIENDPSDSVKDKAMFSLSEIESETAEDALLAIATSDKYPDLKGKALFWLAHVSPNKAKALVLEILKNTNAESDINQAVFTLTQMSEGNNDDMLFQLLKGDYSGEVKKQALFWLSQSDNSETIGQLEKLL